MARALSPQEAVVLGLSCFQVRVRVLIRDSVGTFVDYSTLEGVNWISSVDYGEDIDQPLSDTTVKLWRAVEDLSLAPLVTGSKINNATGSYFPRIDVGRAIRIETATIPEGVVPAAADWRLVFEGEIDEIDWGTDGSSSVVTLVARDKAATLQDHFLEKEGRTNGDPYGSDLGVAVETVMQQILDDWAPGVTLYTPNGTAGVPIAPGDVSNWLIKPYGPRKQSVMDALRELAEMIGYEVRYRWSNVTSEIRLEFYAPDRVKTVPDITLSPFQYYSANRTALNRAAVRNFIRVSYQTDPDDETTRTSVTRSDSASITRYGRRYMEIAEAASSAINTATEAGKMADAALADLKDPKVDLESDCAYRYDVQLGDLVRYKANRILFDVDQDLAVVSVRHRLTESKARTVIAVRGKPAGGYITWIKKGAWPGLADFIRTLLPKTPTLSVTAKIQGAILVVTNLQNYKHLMNVEFHLSTTSGFTPSPATLAARSQTNRAEIAGLTPGTTYYTKAVVTWAGGLKSSTSSQASFTPGLIATIDLGDLIITNGKLADGAVTDLKVNAAAGIVGTKLSAGAGVLAHLSSGGIFDDLANVTRRVLDDVSDGASFKKVSGVSASNLVTSSSIAGLAVGTAALTDLNVTSGKLASGAVTTDKASAGFVVSYIFTNSTAAATTTAVIPKDDTTFAVTTGTQMQSLGVFTTESTSGSVVYCATSFVSHSDANANIVAYVTGNDVEVLNCLSQLADAGADPVAITNHARKLFSVQTAFTHRVRLGSAQGATATYNGASGARLHGTNLKSSLGVFEIKG